MVALIRAMQLLDILYEDSSLEVHGWVVNERMNVIYIVLNCKKIYDCIKDTKKLSWVRVKRVTLTIEKFVNGRWF